MSDGTIVRASSTDRVLIWVLALGFGVLAFALNFELERRFDKLRAFGDFNLLFDTDPIVQLETFEAGENPYGRNLSHPNLANLFNPPLRVLAETLTRSGLAADPAGDLGRRLALLVVPTASGLKATVVFWLCVWLGLDLLQSSLVTLLGVVSFSQLVFGSIPDHWALGGLAITLAFLLAADLLRREGRIRWWAWVAVGTVAMGITTTNILIVALVFWVAVALSTRQLIRPTLQALGLGAAALGLTVLIYAAGSVLYGIEVHQSVGELKKWTQRHLEVQPGSKVLQFPAAMANTLAPPDPNVIENRLGKDRRRKRTYQFSLDDDPALSLRRPLGAMVLAVLAMGALLSVRGSPEQRVIGWAALAVIVFNFSLHAVWGQEYFLYSQHWHAALLVLIIGIMAAARKLPRVASGLLGVFVGLVAVNNILRLELILEVLTRFQP